MFLLSSMSQLTQMPFLLPLFDGCGNLSILSDAFTGIQPCHYYLTFSCESKEAEVDPCAQRRNISHQRTPRCLPGLQAGFCWDVTLRWVSAYLACQDREASRTNPKPTEPKETMKWLPRWLSVGAFPLRHFFSYISQVWLGLHLLSTCCPFAALASGSADWLG